MYEGYQETHQSIPEGETETAADAAAEAVEQPEHVVHGVSVKAVSPVSGKAFTPQERQEIIGDAWGNQHSKAAKEILPEYTGKDEIPFPD